MYEVRIAEASRELTARERLKAKDTDYAIKIDDASNGKKLTIAPVGYVVLDVHNTESTDTDYQQYVIEGKDGNRYVTGSTSFFSAFMDIWNEMCNETEDWEILVTRKPSKKYSGKEFLSCSII